MLRHIKLFSILGVVSFLIGFSGLVFSPLLGQDTNTSHSQGRVFSWPVNTHLKLRISSTFGESRLDHFHNGLDIAGKNLKVYPMVDGVALWKTEAIHKPGEIPFGGGKTIIVDSGEHWTGFMHLDSITPIPQDANIKRENALGRSGDTGHSGGAHLHFFIYEKKTRKIFNPLLLLESNSLYKNSTAPRVTAYGIKLPDRFTQLNIKRSFRMSQDYPIYAKLVDSATGRERWGVYKIDVYKNENMDKPIRSIVFDYIQYRNGQWQTSGGLPFNEVYFENWYRFGTGFKKSGKLIWVASGYQGPFKKEIIQLDITD
ncbi:MAG: M23 family metallopeptidase [Leptospirales bacterium]